MEGINHEAAGLAGHLGLGRLNVLWDNNRITIDGSTDLSRSEDTLARYAASGWHTVSCDGHDFADIRRALDEALADPRPSLIDCRTIIGKGAPNKQGTAATHGAALGADEVAAARTELGWDSAPFEIPGEILAAWREAGGAAAATAHEEWRVRLAASPERDEFVRRMEGRLPDGPVLDAWLDRLAAEPQKIATRKASELALEAINAALPETIGGSADLTGSNNTKTKAQKPLTARRLFRPLYLLRHPRVRHGRGDERHGAARRRHPLWRHLPGLLRLLPAGDPAFGAAECRGSSM